MSDYKRFVSYIYGYDQGEKGENTLYASTIGRGSSYSSMYNGLWGLYDPDSTVDAQDKGNWNRE